MGNQTYRGGRAFFEKQHYAILVLHLHSGEVLGEGVSIDDV